MSVDVHGFDWIRKRTITRMNEKKMSLLINREYRGI